MKNCDEEFLRINNIQTFETNQTRYYILKDGRKTIISPCKHKDNSEIGWDIRRNPTTKKFEYFNYMTGFQKYTDYKYARTVDETISLIIEEEK